MVLANLEEKYLGGKSIGERFDMLVGTSTGGIIVLGLGQKMASREIADLYTERGKRIFSPKIPFCNKFGILRYAYSPYDPDNLKTELDRVFGDKLFGSSNKPTCIPAFESRHGEPYIYKTKCHPDYKKDHEVSIVKIALATAAAPTYFKAQSRDGYIFTDGGIWANNPVMVGLTDALCCYKVFRDNIRILSIGCGEEKYRFRLWHHWGGMILWAQQFVTSALKAQSHNALGQAGLLIGRHNLTRIDPDLTVSIPLDDYDLAMREMPAAAEKAVLDNGEEIHEKFLK